MSMSWYEAEQEEAYSAMMDTLAEELYPQHKEQAVDEFIESRLKSYYQDNSEIAVKAVSFILKAKNSIKTEPTMSLVYSSIATEVILKSIVLKPVVFGHVHTPSLAELISSMLVKQGGLDRFRGLVFSILERHIELPEGLEKYKIDGSNFSLWNERGEIQKIRNNIMHKAEECSIEQAESAYLVAVEFFELTKLLIKNIGFEFDDEYRIIALDEYHPKL